MRSAVNSGVGAHTYIAIPIAMAASDFPFRLLVDAVTHVLSVFRVCKVPLQSSDNYVTLICSFMMMMMMITNNSCNVGQCVDEMANVRMYQCN